MMRVFIADDEDIIRDGIRGCIEKESDRFLFAGEAPDGEMALPMIVVQMMRGSQTSRIEIVDADAQDDAETEPEVESEPEPEVAADSAADDMPESADEHADAEVGGQQADAQGDADEGVESH